MKTVLESDVVEKREDRHELTGPITELTATLQGSHRRLTRRYVGIASDCQQVGS